MASMTILTKPLTRAEIAEIATNPRQQKFLESLGKDVSTALPDAVGSAASSAASAQSSANTAQSGVNALAEYVAANGLDALPALVASLQAQIKVLSDRIAALEEGPNYA